MNAHGWSDVANLNSNDRSRMLARGLRAAFAALIVLAATPAFANQGDSQDMLAENGDFNVTNGSG